MIVYRITNKITGKSYIGQTTTSLEYRFEGHLKKMRQGYKHPLQCALRKYGPENFIVRPIFYAESKQELNRAELIYIKYYRTLSRKYGYNLELSAGSESQYSADFGKRVSLGVRRFMRSAAGARAREKMSLAKLGKPGVNKGRHWILSKESRANIGRGHLGLKYKTYTRSK